MSRRGESSIQPFRFCCSNQCALQSLYPLWPRSPMRNCEQGQETGRRFPGSAAGVQALGVCMRGSSKSQSSALIFTVRGEKGRRESHGVSLGSQASRESHSV